MISLFLLVFLVIGTGANPNFIISPDDAYYLKLTDAPPPCYIQMDKNNVLEWDNPSRLDGFSLRGTYKCDRPIFEYGERNSFVDYVTTHQLARAKGVAQVLNERLGDKIRKKLIGPIILDIQSEDSSLRSMLLATFASEITQTIGPNSVRRELSDEKYAPRVLLRIFRLQDPIEFLNVQVLAPDELGDLKWQQI